MLTEVTGWYHNHQDLRTHPFHYRGRGGRGDRRRTPASGHSRCCHRHAIHASHESAPVSPRPASPIKGDSDLSPEGHRRPAARQPRRSRQLTRHLQPPPQPVDAQARRRLQERQHERALSRAERQDERPATGYLPEQSDSRHHRVPRPDREQDPEPAAAGGEGGQEGGGCRCRCRRRGCE